MRTQVILVIFILLISCQTKESQYRIETSMGEIIVELYTRDAPLTTSNFIRYANEGIYDSTFFHRVCTPENEADRQFPIEVVQAADLPEDMLFPPIIMENTNLTGIKHQNGTISMARMGPDTAQSSFFICIGEQPELDYGGKRNPDGHGFAAFGKVIKGMEVVLKIQSQKNTNQLLDEPVLIYKIAPV